MLRCLSIFALSFAVASPAFGRDSLGLYEKWGAFRDAATPRCYAIAMADPNAQRRDYQPFATIGTWPKRAARNQIHFRLSRKMASNSPITLWIGTRRFSLTGGGGDAWAANARDNAAIIATIRSATRMQVRARDSRGRPFTNTWQLAGAASAMDSASIGCAKLG